MLDLEVLESPSVAAAAIDPVRSRILASLVEPGSATSVAAAIGETRQKVNYHLRALEDHGLVTFVEDRPRRGLTERVVQASARSYVVSPSTLGEAAAATSRTDPLSARYLIALGARLVREVADLVHASDKAGRVLPTLAIDTDIRFASAASRAAFTEELARTVIDLAARYHEEHAPHGRWHRLVIAAHPRPAAGPSKSQPEFESSNA